MSQILLENKTQLGQLLLARGVVSQEQIDAAKKDGVLLSLHLKATMMKVSDPIMFGHCVSVFFAEALDKHAEVLAEIGANVNNGLADVLEKLDRLPAHKKAEIEADLKAALNARPPLYMVDSDRGITNLHVPSDVIIDASMPALIRAGGKGWGPDGAEHDTNCVIPDNSYAPVYDETIRFFKANGKLNPATAGTVQNLGLMAQKAEEYGSHPTTFEIAAAGVVKMILDDGTVLHRHSVEAGDIWRMAMVKDAAVRDWVRLAVSRARISGIPAVFWLNEKRAHDAQLVLDALFFPGRDRLCERGSGGDLLIDRLNLYAEPAALDATVCLEVGDDIGHLSGGDGKADTDVAAVR